MHGLLSKLLLMKNFVQQNVSEKSASPGNGNGNQEDKSVFILKFKEAQKFYIEALTVSYSTELEKKEP